MSSLCEMPELVKEEIIKFCDFREVLTLRQVCQDFKNFLDDLKISKLPDSEFEFVGILVKNENQIRLTFYPYSIDYYRKEKSRKFGNKTTFFKNDDILDIAIFDLERVLKFQKSCLKSIECDFSIDSSPRTPEDSIVHILPAKLSSISKLLISAKKLQILAFKQAQIMKILPLLNPKFLEEIQIKIPKISQYDRDDSLGMDQIMETEQWKNAKNLNCEYYALGANVKNIAHFSNAKISFASVSVRNLDILRKALLNSPKFEHINISIKFVLEHDLLSVLWGDPIFSGYFVGWYFKMSDGDVMKIDYKPGYFRNPVNFEFTRIKVEEVPADAIVQEFPIEN